MEWISVNDKLPEEFQSVFISDGFIVSKGNLVEDKFFDFYNEDFGEKITHWMPVPDKWVPLPDPPK
jgi:hypothetical protein